ncbi:MAG: RDD family protein [Bacteriovorax sp.]|nr:RDD family protein [Bacteriovorax sp.]
MFQTSDILKKRVYALTTDFFIVVLTNYFLMASFTNFLKTVFFHFPLHAQLFLVHKLAMMTSVSLMSLTFAYFSIFYFVTNGRTLGKTIFGLKVVSPEGEITLKQSMQRSFAYFACAMFGSFLFALSFIRKDYKSLADVLSGTNVAYDIQDENAARATGTEFQLALVESMNESSFVENQQEIQEEVEYFEQNKAA